MKKLFCLLAFLCLLITSCTSTEDSPPLTESNVLLKKTVELDDHSGFIVTTNYYYNGRKITKSVDSFGEKSVYTYTGDFITKIQTYSGNTLWKTETFAYNSNGQLITYLGESEEAKGKVEYTYNADGTAGFISYSWDSSSLQYNESTTGSIQFSGDMASTITSNSVGSSTIATDTFTYDGNNNPFKNVIGFEKISIINPEEIVSSHNTLTFSRSFTSGGYNYAGTYTYNSLNFPVTSSVIWNHDNNSLITTQFTYY